MSQVYRHHDQGYELDSAAFTSSMMVILLGIELYSHNLSADGQEAHHDPVSVMTLYQVEAEQLH